MGKVFKRVVRNVGNVVKPLSKLTPIGAAYNVAKYGKVIGKPEEAKRGDHLTSKEMTSAQKREAMLKDVSEGRKFGKEILGDGLGRLGEKQSMKDVLARRRQQMEEGIGAQEQEAFRSKLLKQMQAAEQKQGLALGSQLGGARGAGAVAQMRSLQQAGLAKRADIETDLFLKQQQAKREGLSAFEKTATEQEKFDIKQAAKEKGIEMAAGMGFGQMGSAERSAATSAQAAVTAAQLQKRKPGIIGSIFGGLF